MICTVLFSCEACTSPDNCHRVLVSLRISWMHSMEKEGGNPLNQITCTNWTSSRFIIANFHRSQVQRPLELVGAAQCSHNELGALGCDGLFSIPTSWRRLADCPGRWEQMKTS